MKKKMKLFLSAGLIAGVLMMSQTMSVRAEEAVSENAVSENAVSENAVSGNTASQNKVSENASDDQGVTMKAGETKKFQAEVSENKVVISENKVVYVWASSDEEVATVDETGAIQMTGGGSATITCTNQETGEVVSEAEISVTLEISISENAVSETEVSENSVSQDTVSTDRVNEDAVSEDAVSEDAVSEDAVNEDKVDGDSKDGEKPVRKDHGNKAEKKQVDTVSNDAAEEEVTWFSTKENVASADADGKIRLSGVGDTTITGSLEEGINATLKAEIKVKKVAEPESSEKPLIIWTSSDTSVAAVDENGNVTAVSPGTVYIIAISPESEDLCSWSRIVVE